MKPAFDAITVKAKTQCAKLGRLTIGGPISLKGNELEAYFWVRVVKKDDSAEAIGNDEMSQRQLGSAKQAGEAAGAAAGTPPDPKWTATIPIKKGKFKAGDVVDVEAWVKVTTDQPKLMFTVYWQEEDFTL
jgi:hypothetical protein